MAYINYSCIKEAIYYIAESLPNFDGANLCVYNIDESFDMFMHVVLMGSYYKDDENYIEYWD